MFAKIFFFCSGEPASSFRPVFRPHQFLMHSPVSHSLLRRFDISVFGHDVGFLFGGVVMAKLGVIVLQVMPAPRCPASSL